jgi:hypothetical protein
MEDRLVKLVGAAVTGNTPASIRLIHPDAEKLHRFQPEKSV